jgi:hypothetical protein
MKLTSRLKKLEEAMGRASCGICRDWWQQPTVIRDEKDPPAPRDPDRCPRCGRQCPKDRIFEIIICEQAPRGKTLGPPLPGGTVGLDQDQAPVTPV